MSHFAIEVQGEFAATHQLRFPDGALEPLHGHQWHVVVRVAAGQLDALETVMDFHLLERLLDGLIAPWRQKHLNDLAPFRAGVNPSAERVAEHLGRTLAQELPATVRLVTVGVTEAPGCTAWWLA